MDFIVISLLLMCLCGSLGQIPSKDKCPEVEVVQNFDFDKTTGTWYLAGAYDFFLLPNGICTTAQWKLMANGSVDGYFHYLNAESGKEANLNFIADGDEEAKPNEAKFRLTFNDTPLVNLPYQILDIDYENFAVGWVCVDAKEGSSRIVWIFSRSRELPENFWEKVDKSLEDNNIDKSSLKKVPQDGCSSDRWN